MNIKLEYFESHQADRISEIKFCCADMSDDFISGRIKIHPYTDYPLRLYIEGTKPEGKNTEYSNFQIKFCPYCGAEIKEN